MKNLRSWLLIMFVLMFWGFRVVVAITASMEKTFMAAPVDLTAEIVLLFVVLACVPFIFKRKLLGAIVYLASYGWYFGRGAIEAIQKLIAGETLSIESYSDMVFTLIGVILPIVVMFDLLIDRHRMNNPVNKETDWFYTNEQYDRQLDERADKNNYRTM